MDDELPAVPEVSATLADAVTAAPVGADGAAGGRAGAVGDGPGPGW